MTSLPSVISPSDALIVIDVQPDFMPGGALACERGDEIIKPINELLISRQFSHVVATQDWHPENHISFVGQHPGQAPFDSIQLYGHPQTLWPPHCMENTAGAALHPEVDWSAVDLILRKGRDPKVDSYSAFRHNPGPEGSRPTTGLADWLQALGIKDVYLCGLARDVCVLWSALDALAAGFNVHYLWSLTRPVSFMTDETTRQSLEQSGIEIIEN